MNYLLYIKIIIQKSKTENMKEEDRFRVQNIRKQKKKKKAQK